MQFEIQVFFCFHCIISYLSKTKRSSVPLNQTDSSSGLQCAVNVQIKRLLLMLSLWFQPHRKCHRVQLSCDEFKRFHPDKTFRSSRAARRITAADPDKCLLRDLFEGRLI